MPELCCAVALAQTENIDLLVSRRQEVASIFMQVSQPFKSWFTPQQTSLDCVNSYWCWSVRLNRSDITWHQFRDFFQSLGGDGIYAAWQLTYLEPMFTSLKLLRREAFICSDVLQTYQPGLCPNAELIQQLMQFKTIIGIFRKPTNGRYSFSNVATLPNS